MNDTWLFLYGTLRPGGWNWPIVREACLMGPFDQATTQGRMYHMPLSSDSEPVYPIVDFEEPGTVHGTLLLVNFEQCRMAHEMEVRSGYRAVVVSVQVSDWHHKVPAMSYHWPHAWRGPVVESGDWRQVRKLAEGVGRDG